MKLGWLIRAGVGRVLCVCGWLMWSSTVLADLDVTGAYLRQPPPGSPVAAVFLQLRNKGAEPYQLIGARSALAGKIEVHTHEHVDGMMRMRPVAQLKVPAYGEVAFKPGGYHLMVFELRGDLAVGAVFPVTLLFADGKEVSIEAKVKRL